MPQPTALKPVTEWIGGTVRLPAYVTGEGDAPYRPETLLWMLPDGPVLGMTVMKPGEAPTSAIEHFRETTRKPMIGRPHTPTRVRVASEELANELRRELGPKLEIVCAPTPEIDRVAASLREHLDKVGTGEKPTYLALGITPAAIAALFRSAARLFRSAPWKIVPDDSSVLSVTIESLGIHGGALSIIGHLGESLGFILFPDHAAFEMFLEAAHAIQEGDEPTQVPPQLALNFERGAEMSADQRKEIASHNWEVAGSNAYPWLVAVDEDIVPRPPTAREVTIAEAISVGLVQLIEGDRRQLRNAWEPGEGFVMTMSVETHAGPIDITLAAPYDASGARTDDAAPPHADAAFDITAAVRDRNGHLDERWFESFSDEVIDRFAASPEGLQLPHDISWCQPFMGFGRDYHGVTVATMSPAQFEEILFGVFPRKMSCDANSAASIVGELRAFWTFLKREFALKHADACLGVLGDDAERKLEKELSNPANFGMAKAILMAGKEAGFDMSSKAGIQSWMSAYNGLAKHERAPDVLPRAMPSAAERRAKRNKRKAQRAGRKKNR